ncbi:hypothetical protein FQA39_LY16124 [Lamprigera yunnana]|nr:hypothetical protein FQA39_LY16124 [Lamprigera yunnana]
MMRLVLVCALLIAVVASAPQASNLFPSSRGKIIGGEPVEIEDYPYQVSIQSEKYHFCGGFIVSPNTILTAAHCIHKGGVSEFTVAYGSKHLYRGTSTTVNSVELHEDYDASSRDYDIALLLLTKKIVFDSTTAEIRMTSTPQSTTRRVTYVSGWGQISPEGGSTDYLQATAVTEVLHEDCNYYNFGRITKRMICFGDYGKYACQTDFGGPLIDKNQNCFLDVCVRRSSTSNCLYEYLLLSPMDNKSLEKIINQLYPSNCI